MIFMLLRVAWRTFWWCRFYNFIRILFIFYNNTNRATFFYRILVFARQLLTNIFLITKGVFLNILPIVCKSTLNRANNVFWVWVELCPSWILPVKITRKFDITNLSPSKAERRSQWQPVQHDNPPSCGSSTHSKYMKTAWPWLFELTGCYEALRSKNPVQQFGSILIICELKRPHVSAPCIIFLR